MSLIIAYFVPLCVNSFLDWFAESSRAFAYQTYEKDGSILNRIDSLTLQDNTWKEQDVLYTTFRLLPMAIWAFRSALYDVSAAFNGYSGV
ncbi:hypothetical protein [Lentibacillus salicampi]|uniref:Uncharacterized protein n=1 Tax=Lentibacillus salicampi TaxID=175306 RepID=A0A4Y9AC13_9BACI|nr:hypothetical protein [Lentibacillus salicampi]TFJ93438.1 hypothetical protein E4U82_07160 [Lentibacillus salicampi]